MILLSILRFASLTEALVFFLVALVVAGIFYTARHFIFDNSRTKEIIEAEKKRQAHPNVQNGMFTRLYTMPFYEELTGELIRAYCEEHFPQYYCTTNDVYASISETRSGLSGETRVLYITHLKEHNITAIDFKDPNEVEYSGRYRQSTIRSSINDKGFSKDIREIVRHFQQEAISKQCNK